MEGRHPVVRGYANLLQALNQQLDSLLSGEAEQWETVKDQIDHLRDLLERDGLREDVSGGMGQIAAIQDKFEEILEEMEIGSDVPLIVDELQLALRQLQRDIAEVPQEKLEAAAWKTRGEPSDLDTLSQRILRKFQTLAKDVRRWQEADQALGEYLSKALENCSPVEETPSTPPDLNPLLNAYSASLSSAHGSIQQNGSLSPQEVEQLTQTLENLKEQRNAVRDALRQAEKIKPLVRERLLGILDNLESSLHNLGNNLYLRCWAAKGIEEGVKAILEESSQAPKGGSPLLTQLAQVCDSLNAFASLTMQTIDSDTVSSLERLLEEYAELTDLPLPPVEVELDREARDIQHILVVEDDHGWQKFIRDAIEEVRPDLSDRIYVVKTYKEALLFLAANLQNAGKIAALGEKTRSLREQLGISWPLSRTPGWKQRLRELYPNLPLTQKTIPGKSCLCLLDLHIPRDAEADRTELLGLDLLELMRYRRLNLRVIILTGTRDFPGVARRAIERGCPYYDYLYKDNPDCKEELKQCLRDATMIPKEGHLIEVFSFTGDLVRIDDVEVQLDRAPFKVFDRLARSRTTPPYENFGVYALWSGIIEDLSSPPDDDEYIFNGAEEDKKREGKLNDHIDHIRKAIHEAFREAGKYIDTTTLIEYFEVIGKKAYKLRAKKIVVYKSVEDVQFAHQPPCILVVEDQPEWHEPIREALRPWHPYPIVFALSYEEALEKAQSLRPNIAVLDMEIPSQDGRCHWEVGVELLRRLRDELPDLQVVVFTAHEARDALREQVNALEVDIHDYISKKSEAGLYELAVDVFRRQRMLEQGSKIIPYRDLPPIYNLELNLTEKSFVIDYQYHVRLTPDQTSFLQILAEVPPLQSIAREKFIERIWPDYADMPSDKENALNSLKARLCKRITEYTGGNIPGDKIIRMSKGVYRLHGVAQISVVEDDTLVISMECDDVRSHNSSQ